jgi:D-tyrosyl-tRNA(Tyr) deacylase
MRLLVQRVANANCVVDGKEVGKIGKGFLVLLGITHTDTKETADYLAKKLINLRVFKDNLGKMNLSIKDVKGELLIISQFTLYANTKDGNRPSFVDAAKPNIAEPLYEYFLKKCEEYDVPVEHGIFGADMNVSLLNDGPVTIELEK